MTKKIDVFISYKREERSLASQVALSLESAGYTQVTDLNLASGDHFGDAIDRMIRDSRIVLVLWTGASADSEWVRNEARLGAELKTYLGIMLEEVELPLDLRYLQCVNLTDGTIEEALPKIIEAVADRLGPPANTPEAAKNQSTALNDELLLFQTVKRADDIETYQTFLKVFPKSHMAEEVRRCIKRLETFGYRLRKNAGLLIAALGVIVALLVGTLQFISSDASSGSSILRNKLKIAQSERDIAKNQLNKATEKLVIVEKYTKSLSVEKNKLSIEIARLKPLNDQVKKLTLARDQAVSDKISIMIEREELSTELNHSLARIGNLIGEKGKLATEVAELRPLRGKINAISQSRDQAIAKVTIFEVALEDQTAKLAKTEKELNDLNTSSKVTVRDLRRITSKLAGTERDYKQLKEKNRSLTAQLEEQAAKITLTQCTTIKGQSGYQFAGDCWNVHTTAITPVVSQVSTLSGINNFTNLDWLFLNGTKINDLSPLQSLSKLTELYLKNTDVHDFSPISQLRNLSHLTLPDGRAFGSIRKTTADKKQVQEFLSTLQDRAEKTQRVAKLPPCTTDDGSPGYNFAGKCRSTNTTEIKLSENQTSTLSGINKFTRLDWLNLSRNAIRDISPLQDLTQLKWLLLINTKIRDISPLQNLTNIEFLALSNTKVSSISPLLGLTKLKWLYLSGTNVVDLLPLKQLKNLEYLTLPDGRVFGGLSQTQADKKQVQDFLATLK